MCWIEKKNLERGKAMSNSPAPATAKSNFHKKHGETDRERLNVLPIQRQTLTQVKYVRRIVALQLQNERRQQEIWGLGVDVEDLDEVFAGDLSGLLID